MRYQGLMMIGLSEDLDEMASKESGMADAVQSVKDAIQSGDKNAVKNDLKAIEKAINDAATTNDGDNEINTKKVKPSEHTQCPSYPFSHCPVVS